jgi:glycosyltransferase involved in cell wall biosynthesis
MNSLEKISVIIITRNEEVNIEDCLKSVKWADEIIIVDAESSDNTIGISQKYTDKIFTHKWEGYAKQKQFALSLAKNEWILSLDADERVTPELKDEIEAGVKDGFDGFKIPRKNYFLGKHIRGCGWNNDYQLRLFKKSVADVTDSLVHESFVVRGKIGRLENKMTHYSYRNINDAFEKINNYSSLEAQQKFRKKYVRPIDFIIHPASAFFQYFIVRKGFIDGKYGLMVSLLHAMTNLQTYMKMWEMKKKK